MLLPLGDHPNPRKPQWVTRVLIGINVVLYLFVTVPLSGQPLTKKEMADPEIAAQLDVMWEAEGPILQARYEQALREGEIRAMPSPQMMQEIWLKNLNHYSLFVHKYGYRPGFPDLVSLFFCMFLHAGFLHLAGNMLYLWIFGDNVEFRLGGLGYLAAYLVTGVAATLAFAAFSSESGIPLVGASGAISGVLGLYLVWFPHNQVRLLVWMIFIFFIHVRAIWVLLAYLVIDNLLPFLAAQGGNVAHGAHLGGFVAGMAGAWVLNRVRGVVAPPRPAPRFERRGGPWRPPPERPKEDSALEFGTAIQQGRMEDAAHAFSLLVREGGAPPAAADVFRLGRWLYENGFVPDTAAVFRYYIKSYPRGDDLDRVHLGLGILLARKLGQPTAAREHLLQAIDLTEADSGIAESAREELGRL
ncbi:MAG: rhomboid family intramembrane serine protease [Planctomycetota bacterium]